MKDWAKAAIGGTSQSRRGVLVGPLGSGQIIFERFGHESRAPFIGATAREQRFPILKDHHIPAGAGLGVVAELARLHAIT
ncbi:MAG TPA: hypothetical protein VFP91_19765 [Vicinamibacterales bacterium]|nr:hypothetical protein [Vicinamibacterales bacterium]